MALADLDPEALYHLAQPAEWSNYQLTGIIEPPSIATEGFVHCSWGHQVAGTVTRFFTGVDDLLALRLDPGALAPARLVEEDSYASGQAFPHLYGEVPSGAVVGVIGVVTPPS